MVNMNSNALVDKIASRLREGIETEENCIYLLTQIRKYLEQQEIKGYWNLRMCANWTLHSKLDGAKNKAVEDFLHEVNDFLIDSEKSHGYDIDKYTNLKYKLLFVTALREELKQLLTLLGIDTSICTDSIKTQNFFRVFGRVIEDTPLVCKTDASSYLSMK